MRARTIRCWQCGGHGVTGRFLSRNIHITVGCRVCRGRGYKRIETVK